MQGDGRLPLQGIAAATVREAACRFGADPERMTLVNDGINVVYRAPTSEGVCYLRLRNLAVRDGRWFASAADFLHHLARSGASVCQPLRSHTGRLVEPITQAASPIPSSAPCPDDRAATLVLAAAVWAVPGRTLTTAEDDLTVVRAWGRALGGLHRASASYRAAAGVAFPTWAQFWADTGAGIDPNDHELRDAHARLSAWLRDLPSSAETFGLTHSDFHRANALWDGERVRVIDFDEPVWHWFISDIARALMDLDHHPDPLRDRLADAFIEGYRDKWPLSSEWVTAISRFAQMKSLAMYMWVLNDWPGSTVPGGEPRAAWVTNHRRRALLVPSPPAPLPSWRERGVLRNRRWAG